MAFSEVDFAPEEMCGTDYIERARALRPLLEDAADEIEERRQLPERVVEALVEGGLFRLLQPRSLGGAELHPLIYVQVLEEIAKAEPSTAWSLGQNSGCSMTAPYLDPAVAREIFGPPRGILAWGPELPGAGRGVAVEGGIRVTGRWGFATGSRHATWLGAHVPVFEPDGAQRMNPNGRPHVRTVLFPKSSAEIIDNWQVIGLRGTGSDSYRAIISSSRRNTPCRATTRPSGARGSPPSLYERHDLRRELLERVARHSPAVRSTPSSCVIQHAATD
jgi:alkylation response protein AidB-like acyl-CoA dehydrogenase